LSLADEPEFEEASINTLIFMESIKPLRRRHRNKHAQGRPPLRRHGFIKSMPLEGRTAPPWWWCLSVVCANVPPRLVVVTRRM
jgi:hypothetical protein